MAMVIESCRISPPAEASGELLVPLSFFDMIFLHHHTVRHLLFYEHPCCESTFVESVVPKLKESLSLTLKHYLLVAGNLLHPSDVNAKKPVLRYATGDSVCLTIAKSSSDFGELIGNHARDADQFYDFVPPIPPTPPPSSDPEYGVVTPLLALQVTLFPGRGICLGLALHHCLGDASSIHAFVSAWASSMNKDAGDVLRPPPTFDRSCIHDTYGTDAVYWEEKRHIPPEAAAATSFPLPTNRVRATFGLRKSDIDKLKAKLMPAAASSFVVTTSYVWSCLVKSGGVENGSQMLVFAADARPLMDPPAPCNYFGNCVVNEMVILEQKKLAAGVEGFAAAAQGIGDAIKKLVNGNKDDELIKSAKDRQSKMLKLEGIRAATAVSGSPKFDFGAVDFGWGKLRCQELVSTDDDRYCSMLFLCKSSTDSDGSLEVRMSLPREEMEAFAAVFADGLA